MHGLSANEAEMQGYRGRRKGLIMGERKEKLKPSIQEKHASHD